MTEIERVATQDILNLRRDMIRPGMDVSFVMYDEDNDEDSFNLGIRMDGKIVSCVTFFKKDNPDLPYKNQYRMRALCTHPDYRGKGFATALINKGMSVVRELGAEAVWFHARVHLVDFYHTFGCVEYGQPFPVKYSCMHINMYKVL